MTLSGRYFLPGPVEIDPEVARAMLKPMIGHRGAEARAIVAAVQPGLQELFGTTRPVMLITGSSTSLMEAGVRAGVRDRVLCVVSGMFGERFANIAERSGKDVVRLHVPLGGVLEVEALELMLDGPRIDAITLVHSETSSGALAPLEQLLARMRQLDDVVTIVDAVSSLGGIAIEFDRWGTDFLLTGSQKAMALPPGLAFAAASDRFLARARDAEDRGFYLDVVHLHESATTSQFPQTPALPVVYALEKQLQRMATEGVMARLAKHRTMREHVEQWVAAHGRCGILAPPGRRSDTVTALTLRPERSARAVATELASLGWQVATGIEPDDDRLLRIGHMGDLQPEQLDSLLQVLEPRL